MAFRVRPVGLLTSRNHPLLPYFLDLFDGLADTEPVLIFDEKDFSCKDRKIFADRTQGAFPERDVAPFLDRYRHTEVPNHNSESCYQYVRENRLGLLVNAGTPRLISPDLIGAASVGILNAHPGILPRYRGASCCEWAIYHDDPVGVTAHFIDAGIDSGPILFSRELPIRKSQTYAEIRVALYHLAHQVRLEAIRMVLDRGLRPSGLPLQPESAVFKPIPEALLEEVKSKLTRGEYRHAI